METNNDSFCSSSEQFIKLKKLKEMLKLHKLQAEFEEFKNELERLTTERSECLEKHERLKEHSISIQDKRNIARKEESMWQIKLDDIKNSAIDDQVENLQNICILLGYQFSKCKLLENNDMQITLTYRNICYVSLKSRLELYDIVEIYPSHPNLSKIQQYLQNSQDLMGFLACLSKFFDSAIQSKKN